MKIEELMPGVSRISRSADWPRPHVGICGSMHGDEPCGGDAVERIAREVREGKLDLGEGTLVVVRANPDAYAQQRRFTRGGQDLNRLWDFAFVETLREEAWGYEHHRALALKPLLAELDVFLDLHSATTATPPFAVTNGIERAESLADRIGAAFVVEAWHGLADKVIIGFLKLEGVPALSVECGAHDDPELSEKAYHIALGFLRATRAIDDATETPSAGAPRVHVMETITKPSVEFRFGQDWTGFQQLEPGALVGRDRLTEIRTTRPCYAVLPNQNVDVGDDVIYLAVDTAGSVP